MLSAADRRALADMADAYRASAAEHERVRLDFYRLLVRLVDSGAMLDEIGAVLGVTRGRVSQLVGQARRAL